MKTARPAKRARLTVERTMALELPDIIHYIYTFSHSCLLSWSLPGPLISTPLGKGKNVPDFSTVNPSGCEKSVKSKHLKLHVVLFITSVCKLAMKWYLMRMCTSWLCPFNELVIWKLNPFSVPNNAFILKMFESKFDCWLDHANKGCSLYGKSKIETYFNMTSMLGKVSWAKTPL